MHSLKFFLLSLKLLLAPLPLGLGDSNVFFSFFGLPEDLIKILRGQGFFLKQFNNFLSQALHGPKIIL